MYKITTEQFRAIMAGHKALQNILETVIEGALPPKTDIDDALKACDKAFITICDIAGNF